MWQALPLVFEVKSGLALGTRSVGIINTTRLYITSRQLWAATTERLTTFLFRTSPPTGEHYRRVGDLVASCLRFSYFYPFEGETRRLSPCYREGGLFFGELPAVELERRYVSSYVSTALDYPQHGAKEKSLHEIEFVTPSWQVGTGNRIRQTLFAGVLWHRDGRNDEIGTITGLCLEPAYPRPGIGVVDLQESVLDDLRVGGERAYGFGRIRRLAGHTWECPEVLLPLPGDDLELSVKDAQPLDAHVLYDSRIPFEGALEPLVGREWDPERGAGRRLAPLGVCFAPGTVVHLPSGAGAMKLRPVGPCPWELASEAIPM